MRSVTLVVSDSVTPWTVACQAPLSRGFSRQEYCSALPFPSPRIFLTQRSNLQLSLALAGRFFTTSTTWEAPRSFWEFPISSFFFFFWSLRCHSSRMKAMDFSYKCMYIIVKSLLLLLHMLSSFRCKIYKLYFLPSLSPHPTQYPLEPGKMSGAVALQDKRCTIALWVFTETISLLLVALLFVPPIPL